jgi:hypothetical protein
MKKILLAVIIVACFTITEKTNAQVHVGISIGVPVVYHAPYRRVVMPPPPTVVVAPAPRYYGYDYYRHPVYIRERRYNDGCRHW